MATTPGSGRVCGLTKKVFWILVVILPVVAIALGVGLGVGLTRANDDDSPQNVNTTVAEIAGDNNVPALGALYVNDTSHVAVAGVRRIGDPVNATTDDVWHLGSNTKSMVATTIGLLIQDDLLTWTSSLGDLLDDAPVDIRDGFLNVTVQQLTTHTSGLTDAPVRSSTDTLIASYELTPAEGRVLLSNFTLSSPGNGTQGAFEYANINYILLGLILDTLTGELAEDVVRTRLWEPLGLSTAGWGPNAESSLSSIDNPWPHSPNPTPGLDDPAIPLSKGTEMRYRDNPPCYNTAGSSHMTLQDYGRWLRLHFDPSLQASLNLSSALITKLHESPPGRTAYTYGGWIRVGSDTGSAEGYQMGHDGSNTFNYVTAIVDVGGLHAAAAVTNVGGEPRVGASYYDATHKVTDELMSGELVF